MSLLYVFVAGAQAQNVGIVTPAGVSTGCVFPDVRSALNSPSFGPATTIYVANDAPVTETVSWGLVTTEFYVRASTLALGCASEAPAGNPATLEWTGQSVSLLRIDGIVINLSDLVFTQGASPSGGAADGYYVSARNGATVNLERSEFRGGRADHGGAIDVSDADLNAIHCTFDDNIAGQSGGAISITSSSGSHAAIIEGTTLTNNQAGDEGGAIAAYDVHLRIVGGQDATTLLHRDPVLTDNIADHGGAVFHRINESPEPLEVSRATFARNDAKAFAVGAGGALRTVVAGDADLRIVDSTFDANEAAFGGAWAHSGGVDATALVAGSTFTDNLADHEGGALSLVDDITVEVTATRFVDNRVTGVSGTDIGGLAVVDGAILDLTNVLAPGNDNASGVAGAVSIRNGGHSTSLHTTIGGASSFGFALDNASSLVLQGSIVWGNGLGAILAAPAASVTVQCSNTQGGVCPAR